MSRDATETVADSIEWVPGPRSIVDGFMGGDIDLAQTVADSFGRSCDSIDEVLDPGRRVGDLCQKDVDSCQKDSDFFQKVVDPGQRVRCMKRLRHWTPSIESLTFWKES